MKEWYCFKDKVKMVEGDVWLSYLETTTPIEGIKCPKCGAAYIPEETVLEKVAEAEKMLENK